VQTLKVITDAAFHPTDPDLVAFATSRSALSLLDLRTKDVSGAQAVEFGRDQMQVRIRTHEQ
jgi:hypothetical protein